MTLDELLEKEGFIFHLPSISVRHPCLPGSLVASSTFALAPPPAFVFVICSVLVYFHAGNPSLVGET